MAYKYPIQLTQQFRFCGNPFRVDMYKGCNFGCKYCFANCRGGNYRASFDYADINIIEKYFHKAFDSGKEYKDVIVELLKQRVPLHLGGMSEPFQEREFTLKLSLKLIELTLEYEYPMIMSTKAAYLPDYYLSVLDPALHAFQISLIGTDEQFIRKYETNTPGAAERISFIKFLKNKGFWVSLRLQPLIDLEQAKRVIGELNGVVDFCTIEHLKIPTDNVAVKRNFEPIDPTLYYRPSSLRNLELRKHIKEQNIAEIKKMAGMPLGCGDNDLHYLSDTRNCCGLDTVKGFENWLKYNYTYFVTGNSDTKDCLWCPEGNVRSFLNPDTRRDGKSRFKEYVDDYCAKFDKRMNK